MSFNAITKAAKAAAGLVATATTGGDDDGATPITQDYIKVNEFDDQDAEPQPGSSSAEEIIGRMTQGRNNNNNLGNRWQGRQQ